MTKIGEKVKVLDNLLEILTEQKFPLNGCEQKIGKEGTLIEIINYPSGQWCTIIVPEVKRKVKEKKKIKYVTVSKEEKIRVPLKCVTKIN